jgi:Tfp pilus assembly ATPase PilU
LLPVHSSLRGAPWIVVIKEVRKPEAVGHFVNSDVNGVLY